MIEAMKQALEALEESHPEAYRHAITSLRQAIEQAEKQEPITYDKTEMNCFVQELYDRKMQEGKRGHYETMFHCVHQAIKRLYTTPQPQREWVGLTDGELKPLCDENHIIYGAYAVDFIQSIEAKLKEKNT